MRSVTFSNKNVAKYVNENFVATWINRNTKFHNCDFNTEKWIAEHNGEAYATKNFCTFFTTPDLDVLHYLSGYYAPSWFMAEMESALAVRYEGFDREFKPVTGGGPKMAKVHDLRCKELKAADDKISKLKPPGKADAEAGWRFQSNVASLHEALAYLQGVHIDASKVQKSGKLIKLHEVIKGYKGGNEFTEEQSANATESCDEKQK